MISSERDSLIEYTNVFLGQDINYYDVLKVLKELILEVECTVRSEGADCPVLMTRLEDSRKASFLV